MKKQMSRLEKSGRVATRSLARNVAMLTAIAGTALIGCGHKNAFNVTETQKLLQAPGGTWIPPKVDLLLVTDDTGSAHTLKDSLQNHVPAFLKQLDNSGWDYHFTTIPLTTYRNVTQVVGSIHDSNRDNDLNLESKWVPAYPGQSPTEPGMISSSFFRLPSDFNEFWGTISNKTLGNAEGFKNMQAVLSGGFTGSNFMRSDAMLAIMVISNGNDTSGVNYCVREDGMTVPCNDGSEVTSFAQYQNFLTGLKAPSENGTPANIKFFAAVAHAQAPLSRCLGNLNQGGQTHVGERYIRMAKALGGESFDVCSQSISQVLTSLKNSLQSTRLNYRSRYLFIDSEPNLSSITVTRYIGGDVNSAQTLAQDPVNGWTYAGYLADAFAIDSPIPMNKSSGFAIELHGTARLIGADTASVNFRPAGAENSVSN